MSRFSIHIVSMFSALLILVVGCFAYSPTVSAEAAEDVVISEGSTSDLTVQSDLGEGLLLDTMVKMLQRGASIDCSNSESGSFSQFLTSLRDDIIFTVMDYTGIDEVSWLSFNNSLNPLDWEITDTWEITRSGTGLADKYLSNRRLRFAQENSEVPVSPDPDYVSYLNTINGSGFFWRDYSNTYNDGGYTQTAYILPCSGYSWFSVGNFSNLNNNSNILEYDGSALCYASNIIDLYIFSSGSSYSIATNLSPISVTGINDWNGQTWNTCYFPLNRDYIELRGFSNTFNYTFNASGSLSYIFSLIAKNFRNVNIYVDGVPWSIVGTNSPIDIPIGDTTFLTDTNTPVYYTYPEPAYFDYQTLYNLLETLYNNHQVIKWQDIQGVITDVNGVPVVCTVQVYRTDYDVLADEQLRFVPYFYNDQDMTEPIQNGTNIINISTSVIPDDLLVVFIWCGGVLLFALVVRRLLE